MFESSTKVDRQTADVCVLWTAVLGGKMTVFFSKTLKSYFQFLKTHRTTLWRTVHYNIDEKPGLVLGVFTKSDGELKLTSTAEDFNVRTKGKFMANVQQVKADFKLGKGHVFYNLDEQFPAIAAVSLGSNNAGYNELEEIDEERENVRIAASAGSRLLRDIGVTKVFLEGFGHPESAAVGAKLGLWQYEQFKHKDKQKKIPDIDLFGEEIISAWGSGIMKADAQNLARKLMDTPSNYKTPVGFAKLVKEAISSPTVNVLIRDKNWAESKKMNAFLGVARGSSQPPVFLEIKYTGDSKDVNPIVFVGKGVTFDSGGISLKSPLHMDVMRADCGGAACVVGAIYAAAMLQLHLNVVGLIPLTENMPSGSALKPGDVVHSMNGKSITVIDTDFEGRLILADALCYAQEFQPQATINLATLTMECIYALGHAASAAYSNSASLYEEMKCAGAVSGDRVWRMPLWRCFSQEVADAQYSDVVNLTGPGTGTPGGSCTAAAFLQEFVPNGEWMHLDIASVMGPLDPTPYLSKGMKGRPTRTLVEFLIKRARK